MFLCIFPNEDQEMMDSQFYRNDLQEVKRRIQSFGPGATYEETGSSPNMLHEYCKRGDYACVNEILSTHVSICIDSERSNAFLCLTDKTGYTALHHAARSCSPKCIKLLLEAGASKYVMNENGENGTEYPYDVIGLNLARTVGISNVADLVAECKRLLLIPSNAQPEQ
jgi:Ankyrin repeat.